MNISFIIDQENLDIELMKNQDQLQIANQFQDLFKLQQIFLIKEIKKQLEQRNLNQHGLAQKMINICKNVQSEQQFIAELQKYQINVSKQFLASLYVRIKQNLPRHFQFDDQEYNEEDQNKQQRRYIEKIQNNMKRQQAYQIYNSRFANEKQKQNNFPGLAIPNIDQIDLGLDDQDGMKQQQKLQPEVKVKICNQQITNNKNEQKKKFDNQEYKKQRRKSKQRLDNSQQQDYHHKKEKKKKQHKELGQKKNKKQKKQKKKKKYYSDQQFIRSQSRSRSRSSSRYSKTKNDKHRSRSRQKIPLRKVQQGEIYQGQVTRVDKFGCFVKLLGVQNGLKGLVHVSEMKETFTPSPFQIVHEKDRVWVKVIGIMHDRIRLSMKNINKKAGGAKGQYINKQKQKHQKYVSDNIHRDIGELTGIKIENNNQVLKNQNSTSYGQMWQLSRMSYMGGGNKSRSAIKQQIEQINIQMNDREPPFLRGQTTKAGVNLSPVRVIKNPEGTLHRQALNAVQYAKQRRQIRQQQNKLDGNNLTAILDQVSPKHNFKKQIKRSMQTIKQQRNSLPIYAYKQQLVKACTQNKVLIVIGQTGSGKTTQITQYLNQAGFSKHGKIGCTQPRRVAAMSVAKRVCEQMGVNLGQEVGYSIRFQDVTSSKTIIKYMTDGMLLREALVDKYLSNYSVIMLDQAHERTIHTDVLFGILKKVVQRRDDFTLIVTSATLEAKKFSTYFFDCKIFSIPGRTYNVEIFYAKQPQTDYLDASLMCVMQIHLDQPRGDILLFLTGQQEIDTACQILKQRLRKMGNQIPQLIILPVYSALPSQLQTKIFQPAAQGKRKCIIATNIAEASLTIDGIFYVVDPGFAKIKTYNSKLGMDSLIVAPISQASAKQRAGRAGRTGPGKCYRIYTQEAYKNQMLPTSVPQIQRANLSNTVLQLKAMGINDLINFDFMDAPPVQTLIAALQQLYYLSALDEEGLLTKLGRKMAEFPLEPPLSKMLLTSVDFGCSQQIITIISMLSIPNIFFRPKQKQTIADQKKAKFNHHQGDHLTLLSVYEAWKKQGSSSSWCQDNFIQQRGMKRAQDVRNQISELLQKCKFRTNSCGGNTALIRKTIVAGFFFHAAKKDPKGGYRTLVDDHQVYIHPSSALFNRQPQWVVYHELIFTTKQYMRNVCAINPKWLIDVAPNFFKFTDEIGFVRKKRNQKLDPLAQKYGDPNAWRLSKRKG